MSPCDTASPGVRILKLIEVKFFSDMRSPIGTLMRCSDSAQRYRDD